jgi:hypothetical protein
MKIKVHNLDNHPTADYTEFIELQDDFKERTPDQIAKLANRIIEAGFKYDFIVWESRKGEKFIIDAHGRKQALEHLTSQGYEVPAVPYTRVHVKNKAEAKKEILYLNSNYGKINSDSEFLKVNFDPEVDFNVELNLGFGEEAVSLKDVETSDEFSLPDGDKEPFQQMTFTLADAQAEQIKEAIKEIKQTEEYKYVETFGNENSNGNSLYLIIMQWAEQKKY